MVRKTIKSPWTDTEYVIRELDPAILADLTESDNPKIQNIKMQIHDLLNDYDLEKERIEKLKTDNTKLLEIESQLLEKHLEVKKLTPKDESFEHRFRIVKYGLVTPKINSQDDYLDLGKDATIIYAEIIILSKTPDDYKEVVSGLFRQQKRGNQESSDDSTDVQPTPKQAN